MTYQHLRDDVMAQLDSRLGRLNVRYNQRDLLKDEIFKLQRRIARAIKSSAPSEQRKAERLSEILKSRMEALSELVEADIARLSKTETKEAPVTSLPLPEFVPPPVG